MKSIYTRRFSEIKGLQKQRIIEYNLSESDGGNGKVYGIVLLEFIGSSGRREEVCSISTNRVLVEDIIRYLYENCVGLESLKDVLEDIMEGVAYHRLKRGLSVSGK